MIFVDRDCSNLIKFIFVLILFAKFIDCAAVGSSKLYTSDKCNSSEYYDPYLDACRPFYGGGRAIYVDQNTTCTQNATGIRRHPDTDKFYYLCQNDSVVICECNGTLRFNPITNHCENITRPTCNFCTIPECTSAGNFVISESCSYCYTCQKIDERLIQNVYSCPPTYSPTRNQCKSMLTEVKKGGNETLTNTPDNYPPCTKPGQFRLPNNCAKYYTCSAKSNGRYYQTRFMCPSGFLYDITTEKCEPADKVKCTQMSVTELLNRFEYNKQKQQQQQQQQQQSQSNCKQHKTDDTSMNANEEEKKQTNNDETNQTTEPELESIGLQSTTVKREINSSSTQEETTIENSTKPANPRENVTDDPTALISSSTKRMNDADVTNEPSKIAMAQHSKDDPITSSVSTTSADISSTSDSTYPTSYSQNDENSTTEINTTQNNGNVETSTSSRENETTTAQSTTQEILPPSSTQNGNFENETIKNSRQNGSETTTTGQVTETTESTTRISPDSTNRSTTERTHQGESQVKVDDFNVTLTTEKSSEMSQSTSASSSESTSPIPSISPSTSIEQSTVSTPNVGSTTLADNNDDKSSEMMVGQTNGQSESPANKSTSVSSTPMHNDDDETIVQSTPMSSSSLSTENSSENQTFQSEAENLVTESSSVPSTSATKDTPHSTPIDSQTKVNSNESSTSMELTTASYQQQTTISLNETSSPIQQNASNDVVSTSTTLQSDNSQSTTNSHQTSTMQSVTPEFGSTDASQTTTDNSDKEYNLGSVNNQMNNSDPSEQDESTTNESTTNESMSTTTELNVNDTTISATASDENQSTAGDNNSSTARTETTTEDNFTDISTTLSTEKGDTDGTSSTTQQLTESTTTELKTDTPVVTTTTAINNAQSTQSTVNNVDNQNDTTIQSTENSSYSSTETPLTSNTNAFELSSSPSTIISTTSKSESESTSIAADGSTTNSMTPFQQNETTSNEPSLGNTQSSVEKDINSNDSVTTTISSNQEQQTTTKSPESTLNLDGDQSTAISITNFPNAQTESTTSAVAIYNKTENPLERNLGFAEYSINNSSDTPVFNLNVKRDVKIVIDYQKENSECGERETCG